MGLQTDQRWALKMAFAMALLTELMRARATVYSMAFPMETERVCCSDQNWAAKRELKKERHWV
jgi:hypothetical protein